MSDLANKLTLASGSTKGIGRAVTEAFIGSGRIGTKPDNR